MQSFLFRCTHPDLPGAADQIQTAEEMGSPQGILTVFFMGQWIGIDLRGLIEAALVYAESGAPIFLLYQDCRAATCNITLLDDAS